MFASLTGTVLTVGLATATIEVRGVGLAVHLTAAHATQLVIGDVALIWATMVIRK